MIIKKNSDEIQNYLTDASNFKTQNCEAVYIPSDTDELSHLVKELNKSKTPFTISGAGTGLCGGRVPVNGVVISTESLNKFLNFNDINKTISADAGIYLNDIQNLASEKGYLYPPDPTETNCYLGGTIATNASGAKSFKYGSTRKWIKSLEMILPNGEFFKINRGDIFAKDGIIKLPSINSIYEIPINLDIATDLKNTAGYFINRSMDAIDLFIGSEGTLSIIARAELFVHKNANKLFSFILFFDSFDSLNNFVIDLVNLTRKNNWNENEISPRLIEFFDNRALEFSDSQFSIKDKFGLWIEQEVFTNEDTLLNKWLEFFSVHNIDEQNIWFASDLKETKRIKDFRHSIPAKVNEYISQHNLRKIGTDIAVPIYLFSDIYNFCRDLSIENNLDFVSYGHIGDSHLHFNILPKNDKEFEIAKKLYTLFCKKAIEFGGTFSAEHGVGKIKKEYLKLMYSTEIINSMFQIKKILDPNLLLNKGNIF